MNKYVILSTDNNREYYELLPLVCYSWRKLGYSSFVLCVGLPEKIQDLLNFGGNVFTQCCEIRQAPGLRDHTVAQIGRLFFNVYEEGYCIISDSDMVIGKDIFTHDGDIVCYGHDLTDRQEIPMCYVKHKHGEWDKMMCFNRETTTEESISKQAPPNAYSDDKLKYWGADQQLLTQRAREYGLDKITFVDRGTDPKNLNLPKGRWDRYNWKYIPEDIIDIHMPRNDFNAQIQVFKRLWPGDDYGFLVKFKEELNKIQ